MKKHTIITSIIVLLGLCFIYLFGTMVVFCPEGRFEKIKRKYQPIQKELKVRFTLRTLDNYLLKIKYKTDEEQKPQYFLNETPLDQHNVLHVRKKAKASTVYLHISKEILGKNKDVDIGVIFPDKAPQEVSITLCNYRKKLAGGIYIVFSKSGYAVAVTPDSFYSIVPIAIAAFFIFCMYSKRLQPVFLRISELHLEQRAMTARTVSLGFFLIFAVNFWVYWPSFSHIFRHDEWFLFFSSKNEAPDFKYFIRHIDWQLNLPYDRLVYRPIHHGMLAFNRVVFDANYLGPHILAFIKHLLACLCIWWMMVKYDRRRISVLFVLLFSVLTINIDSVIWPHVDAYIVTAIFTVLSIIFFLKTTDNRISPFKGFSLVGFFLLFNLLTTEIVFLMPIVFPLVYWALFRDPDDKMRGSKDRASWLMLLLPITLWIALFSVHLYNAWPNLSMTEQSRSIGLWLTVLNIPWMLLILLTGAFVPILQADYGDKIYFSVDNIAIVSVVFAIILCVRYRKNIFKSWSRELSLIVAVLFSVLLIICSCRAGYVYAMLRSNDMACHYTYCLSALSILAIYLLFDFDKISKTRKLKAVMFLVLVFLMFFHSLKSHQVATEVERRSLPLKRYFDSVKSFVDAHKAEQGFSFKIIDPPPKIQPFPWYTETCIYGFFSQYIEHNTPKYILEYDYQLQELQCYLYDSHPLIIEPAEAELPAAESDYVNSIGMSFKKISAGDCDILMGISEVTQRRWKMVMGTNPSYFKNPVLPVDSISFYMARDFIDRLNKVEGNDFYRLPTLQEYLLAVNISSPVFYRIQNSPERYAWIKNNAKSMTHPVGMLEPTACGLYDVIGNVWEWTSTPIHESSPASSFEDNPCVCFGGSWRDGNINSDRLTTSYQPDFRHKHLGFRLVRKIEKPDEKEE